MPWNLLRIITFPYIYDKWRLNETSNSKFILSDKVLYLVASFICNETNLPNIPQKTIVLAAVKTNILLLINLDLMTVFPDPKLIIDPQVHYSFIKVKNCPNKWIKKKSKKSVIRHIHI